MNEGNKKHGSLFNGMGGFQLAAEWMGWENVMSCEIDNFCNTVTKHYWPNCIQHYDIRETDFTIYRGQINVLTGGFPCQPYSLAGSRKGKEDDRHLWPEMRRAIREIQPAWIIGENVRGIVSWNNGLVFDEVQTEMEAEGYEVTPFEIPACGIGAYHIRERVWFLAHSRSLGWQDVQGNNGGGFNKSSHTERTRPEREERNKKANELDSSGNTFLRFQEMHGQPAIYDVDDGLPFRLDGITVPKWIEKSCTAAGNAIDPRVAFEIFKAIEAMDTILSKPNPVLNPSES